MCSRNNTENNLQHREDQDKLLSVNSVDGGNQQNELYGNRYITPPSTALLSENDSKLQYTTDDTIMSLKLDVAKWQDSKALIKRAILKNGQYNIRQKNIANQHLKYLQDIFTTLLDSQWRWTLLVFSLSFILTWLGFGFIYWLMCYIHGDFEEFHLPDKQLESGWKPCVYNAYNYVSCFLYSIETQHTIGYGVRATTEECPEAIFTVCIQCVLGVLIQAFMGGIVFAKLIRAKQRTQTLVFSKKAIICQRDGEMLLMFRVGDIRKSHIIGGNIRAQLIQSKQTKEGEHLAQHQRSLKIELDDCDSDLFFIWPMIAFHRINSTSPFYNMSAIDLYTSTFEIIVILEGTIDSTSQTTQARSSYTNKEIQWGFRFQEVIQFNVKDREYIIDYSRFDEISPVDTPHCSAKELDNIFFAMNHFTPTSQ